MVLFLGAAFCQAATNYCVVPDNAGATPPYTDWPTAATNIQEVVNGCLAGDTIYLTNGHYYLTGEVVVAQAVIIRSFNNGATDPTNTILDGNNYAGKPVTNRCLIVTNAAATIDGLTLTNGRALNSSGGGCRIPAGISGTVILTNCIISGNSATNVNQTGGGVSASSLAIIANCRITGNRAASWGGGVMMGGADIVLKDSLVGWNYTSGDGAGVAFYAYRDSAKNCSIVSNDGLSTIYLISLYGVVSNCVIQGNTNGTPIAFYDSTGNTYSQIVNCQIIGNYSSGSYPAGGNVSCGVLYRNCLIANNQSSGTYGGLYVIANRTGTVESCTIAGNRGTTRGGVYADSGSKCYFYNTVISSNVGSTSSDLGFANADAINNFTNCCCPTVSLPPTQGNIQSDPFLAGLNSGNYRLSPNSPCVNTGLNKYWMTNTVDLDGNRRLDQLNGRVDMGAYEFIHTITLISGF